MLVMKALLVLAGCYVAVADGTDVADLTQYVGPACLVQFFDEEAIGADAVEAFGAWQTVVLGSLSGALMKDVECWTGIITGDASLPRLKGLFKAVNAFGNPQKTVYVFGDGAVNRTGISQRTYNFDIVILQQDDSVWQLARHVNKFSVEDSPKPMDDRLLVQLIKKRPLRLGVPKLSPFIYTVGEGEIDGIDVDAWRILARALDWPVVYVKQPGPKAGPKMVAAGKIDAGMFQFVFNHLWLDANDLTPSTNMRTASVMARKPVLKDRLYRIVEPLDPFVWICLTASVLLVWAAFYYTSVVLRRGDLREESGLVLSGVVTLSILWSESLPSPQVASLRADKSRQALFVTWLLTASLVAMAYKSNLLAALVKTDYEKAVETFQDILDMDMIMHLNKRTMATNFLRTNPNPVAQKVYQTCLVDKDGFFTYGTDGLPPKEVHSNVVEGRGLRGFIEELAAIDLPIYHKSKDLVIGSLPVGYYHALNHPLMERADVYVERLLQAGIVQALTAKHIFLQSAKVRQYHRDEVLPDPWNPIEFRHVQATFAMSLMMLAAALVSLFVEKFNFAFGPQRHDDQQQSNEEKAFVQSDMRKLSYLM